MANKPDNVVEKARATLGVDKQITPNSVGIGKQPRTVVDVNKPNANSIIDNVQQANATGQPVTEGLSGGQTRISVGQNMKNFGAKTGSLSDIFFGDLNILKGLSQEEKLQAVQNKIKEVDAGIAQDHAKAKNATQRMQNVELGNKNNQSSVINAVSNALSLASIGQNTKGAKIVQDMINVTAANSNLKLSITDIDEQGNITGFSQDTDENGNPIRGTEKVLRNENVEQLFRGADLSSVFTTAESKTKDLLSTIQAQETAIQRPLNKPELQNTAGVSDNISRSVNRNIQGQGFQSKSISPEGTTIDQISPISAKAEEKSIIDFKKSVGTRFNSFDKTLSAISSFERLLDEGLQTGALEDNFNKGLGLFDSINVLSPELRDRLSKGQASKADTVDLMLGLIQLTKGSISESENKLFTEAVPNINNTVEANRRVIKSIRNRLEFAKTKDSIVSTAVDAGQTITSIRQALTNVNSRISSDKEIRDAVFPNGIFDRDRYLLLLRKLNYNI